MQAQNYAFLQGFLPSFAKAQMVLIHCLMKYLLNKFYRILL